MVHLDAVWNCHRYVKISGKTTHVPFGVRINPDLVEFITRWVQCSGVEYAASRVKSLRIWALHILAGYTNYKVPWFKTKTYKGYVIPRLKLFEYLIDSRHDLKVIKTVLCVLSSYKQRIVGEPSLDTIMKTRKSGPAKDYVRHLLKYCNLPRVPAYALEPTLAVNTHTKYADDFGVTHEGPMGLKDADFPAELGLVWASENEDPYCLGRLIPIPDKGKYRNILIGHWALQLKTKKLADWLRQWLWKQPQVASGDQNKMVQFILEAQKANKMILSIDLSEATDRLSVDFQKQILIHMGCPDSFLNFFCLPFIYRDKDYGGVQDKLKKGWYSNGQPMGLYISFPMFELAHYVVLQFAIATSDGATFCICGDDVVIACGSRDQSDVIFSRYRNLIERFGGIISESKTMISSDLAEGVGALFLKGYKDIRIPTGKLSTLEAYENYTQLNWEISHATPLGRAILYPWLSTKETKSYTYTHRQDMNEYFLTKDLSYWSLESLRSLCHRENMPQTWDSWLDSPGPFWMMSSKVTENVYFYLGKKKFLDSLLTNKIITLLKGDKNCQKIKDRK